MKVFYFAPAILWFIITVVLLTLPQNDLPHNSLFDIPHFDKYVHLVMFFMLTTLFCFPFSTIKTKSPNIKALFFKIALYVILYGIIMEFVQKFFTTTRSFDAIDVVFDSVGSLFGFLATTQYVSKK